MKAKPGKKLHTLSKPTDSISQFKDLALWAQEHGAIHIEAHGVKLIFHPDYAVLVAKSPAPPAPEAPKDPEQLKAEVEKKFKETLFRSSR